MPLLPKILPAVGSRVGTVCGPSEFPRDNAGTVLSVVTDRWGTHAVVLMDSGKTETCHGLNRGPGIGWHALEPEKFTARPDQYQARLDTFPCPILDDDYEARVRAYEAEGMTRSDAQAIADADDLMEP